MKGVEIKATTRKINFHGRVCYKPTLVVRDGNRKPTVHKFRGVQFVNRKDALEFAEKWRLNSLEMGCL